MGSASKLAWLTSIIPDHGGDTSASLASYGAAKHAGEGLNLRQIPEATSSPASAAGRAHGDESLELGSAQLDDNPLLGTAVLPWYSPGTEHQQHRALRTMRPALPGVLHPWLPYSNRHTFLCLDLLFFLKLSLSYPGDVSWLCLQKGHFGKRGRCGV